MRDFRLVLYVMLLLAALLGGCTALRLAYEKVGIGARLLLALLREMGGSSTAGDLNVAANRIGIGGFDDCLTELMRYALVVYAGAGSVKHELWRNAQYQNYGSGWTPSLDYEVAGLPEALALAGAAVLPGPAHHLKPFEGELGAVHDQSPSVLLHGLFTVARWCGGRQVKITKTTGTVAKNDLKVLAKQFNDDENWCGFLLMLGAAAGFWRERERILSRSNVAPRAAFNCASCSAPGKGFRPGASFSAFPKSPRMASTTRRGCAARRGRTCLCPRT